ncbi:MAG: secondary thiamine-phosphate synthase enzyme YjbQ [Acidobacteriota bacterium]|nr:MAG: YjbQ family protein [Acidobacteriota bacterium]
MPTPVARVHGGEIALDTSGGVEIHDLTDRVEAIVRESGIGEGIVVVSVPGSTGALTTIEHEPGLERDLAEALERLVPRDRPYHHDARWGDGNGHSHVRASLIGPSVALPVRDGAPVRGTWQQIVFVELDNRPRRRRLVVQVVGAAG